MSSEREVVVLSGARTAIGDYGGALKDLAPTELAGQIIREAVKRAKVDPKSVGTMVLGNINTTNLEAFNEATLSFTARNPTGRLDPFNSEQGWNMLPNGTHMLGPPAQ